MTSLAVEVDGLAKCYGDVKALDGLTFRAAAGKVTAILGPNGAGKTTAIEICEGFQRPDTGRVRVLGRGPQDRGLRARVGVMPQSGGAYQAAKVGELVALFASLYATAIPPRELLARLGIDHLANRTVKRLSGGEAQRLSLALALVGRPELVFLDEPTASLDVAARRSTWELIGQLRDAGVAVILTTHYIEEASALADEVVIIDAGRAIASGSPADLVEGGQTISFRGGPELADLPIPSGLILNQPSPGMFVVVGTVLRPIDHTAVAEVSAALAAAPTSVTDLRVGAPSLEETFVRLTGRSMGTPPS